MQFDCTICHTHGNLWRNLGSICVTKCGHIFHLDCLIKLFSSASKSIITCPMSVCIKRITQATSIQIDPTFVEKRKNNKNEPVDCIICNDPVTDPENISVTKCGHIYHFQCLGMLVRIKSKTCLVCGKKLTQASMVRLRPVIVSDVTSAQPRTVDELREFIEDTDGPCPPKMEPKRNASPGPSCKREMPQVILTKIQPVEGERCDHQESTQSPTEEQLPSLLQDINAISGQKNDAIDQQIKHELESECSNDILDECQHNDNETKQCQELVKLKKEYKALKVQIEALKKDLNVAKNETAIWEMCFKYLQGNSKDTEMMIPNEKTLELLRENEKLKTLTQNMERERNDAKKESAIWEMCFKFFQKNCNGTEMMMPDEKTLELIKINGNLNMRIQDLGRKLVSAQKDVKSAASLRADLENYIGENLNLKNENEEMKRDLKTIKEEMSKFDTTITDLVLRHSHENSTVNELNDSILQENTRLTELNETLQSENNKLQELVTSLQKNDKLNELENTIDNNKLNEDVQKDNKRLKEHNETLQKENDKLNELVTSLQEVKQLNELENAMQDINTLNDLNDFLQKDNNSLNELNETLQKNNSELNENNEAVLKENNKLKELVTSLQKEKRDFQWGLISCRRPGPDSQGVKRRYSETNSTTTNKQAKDLAKEKAVKQVVNKEASTKEVVYEEAVKKEVVEDEVVNKDVIHDEPDVKRIKLETDTDDVANLSSSTRIDQAVSQISDSLYSRE